MCTGRAMSTKRATLFLATLPIPFRVVGDGHPPRHGQSPTRRHHHLRVPTPAAKCSRSRYSPFRSYTPRRLRASWSLMTRSALEIFYREWNTTLPLPPGGDSNWLVHVGVILWCVLRKKEDYSVLWKIGVTVYTYHSNKLKVLLTGAGWHNAIALWNFVIPAKDRT